jgi:hypothetical protein
MREWALELTIVVCLAILVVLVVGAYLRPAK